MSTTDQGSFETAEFRKIEVWEESTNIRQSSATGKQKIILVPVDASEPSRVALNYSLTLAKLIDAHISVLMVADDRSLHYAGPIYLSKSLVEEAREALKQQAIVNLERFLLENKIPSDISEYIAVGDPLETILAFVDNHQIDMVVMGTHGRTGVAHMVLGSVTEKVIQQCNCPVVSIRPQLERKKAMQSISENAEVSV